MFWWRRASTEIAERQAPNAFSAVATTAVLETENGRHGQPILRYSAYSAYARLEGHWCLCGNVGEGVERARARSLRRLGLRSSSEFSVRWIWSVVSDPRSVSGRTAQWSAACHLSARLVNQCPRGLAVERRALYIVHVGDRRPCMPWCTHGGCTAGTRMKYASGVQRCSCRA